MKAIKVYASDLDGTLVDSPPLVASSYQRALEKSGIIVSYKDALAATQGRHYRDFLVDFWPDITEAQADSVRALKNALYLENIPDLKLNVGLINLLIAQKSSAKIALVTTSGRATTDLILKTFNLNFFDLVITGDDVSQRKPSPEAYQKVIDYFNISPSELLVFEDSEAGLHSARAITSSVIRVGF